MTDQKYKLVPSPITNKMIERAGRAYDRAGNKPTVGTFLDAIEKAIEAAIAAAPEPVISDAMCDAALNVVTGEVDGALFPEAYSGEEIRDARRWMREALSAAFDATPEPVCKEPPVAWWNGMPASPLEGMPPSIRWGADAEDTYHDIPLYAGFNPVHTSPPAPEPMCRWRKEKSSAGVLGFRSSCHDVFALKDVDSLYQGDCCPSCGKKVEMVGNE